MSIKALLDSSPAPRAFSLEDCQFTVSEAAQHLRISRAYFYKLVEAGKITPVKCGKRTLVQGPELRRFMKSLAA
ncbi:hypothetical protein ASD45_19180 [Pseudolabrys sp. Root1462]|uniref:helix-turn-helix domain-containing protein n=1 Tax=Pseudolabrys sp. Root1462 TaxID=1736466 RepID=UPI0007025F87|nr:helix-turn-helix domain-containing protein [Pseudolabrys sp. Root1462]KQY98103.1 hypothetical protein ASD45_19180 [Pseudolabrys sp. Root1462]